MNRDDWASVINLKRESMRESIRKSKNENLFKQKRVAIFNTNLYQFNLLMKTLENDSGEKIIVKLEEIIPQAEQMAQGQKFEYNMMQLQYLNNYIQQCKDEYTICLLTQLLGQFCRVNNEFQRNLIQENLQVAILNHFNIEDKNNAQAMIFFISTLLENEYTEEGFIERILQIVFLIDEVVTKSHQFCILLYAYLIKLLSECVDIDQLIGYIQNLCSIHMTVFISLSTNQIEDDKIHSFSFLLCTISNTLTEQSYNKGICRYIIAFVKMIAFQTMNEKLSEQAINLISKALSGSDEQTYLVLYYIEDGDVFFEQKLLKFINDQSQSINTRKQAALALSNLMASEIDLQQRFFDRGSTHIFLEQLQKEQNETIEYQMVYGLRNIICMVDSDIFKRIFTDQLVDYLCRRLKENYSNLQEVLIQGYIYLFQYLIVIQCLIEKENWSLELNIRLGVKQGFLQHGLNIILQDIFFRTNEKSGLAAIQNILTYLNN